MYCTSRVQAKAGDPVVQGCLRKLQSLVAWNQVAAHIPQYSPLTYPEKVSLAVTAYGRMTAHTQTYTSKLSSQRRLKLMYGCS